MLAMLSKHWWVFLVRGVLAILFGVMAWMWPGLTLVTLVFFFGAWALVSGIFSVVGALRGKAHSPHWWVWLLQGLLGIAIGILTFARPGVTALALMVYIAAWSIVSGVFEVLTAIRLRKEIQGEGWLILAGIASVVFGLLILLFPGAGALALLWLIAAYAILFGVLLLAVAFKLKKLGGVGAPVPRHA
jgi:uncharacterized membrane protein HdeD (DUF308 family)